MKIVFSPLNSLRFVRNESQIGNRYNTNKYDDVVFYEQRLSWQNKACFLQPIQKNDILSLLFEVEGYVLSGGGFIAKLELKNSDNQVVYGVNLENTIDQDSNLEYFYVTPRTFYSGVNEGNYYFQLTLPYVVGDDYYAHYYYSEPISVKAKHEDTVLLNYTNSYNQYYIPFETTNSFLLSVKNKLEYRVYGALINMQQGSERFVFTDQNSNAVSLKTNVFRGWDFYIGGNNHPLPDWVLEKVNHVFGCDTVTIDNVRYSPIDSASVEKDGSIYLNKYGAKISLKQYNYQNSFTQEYPPNIALFEFPQHQHVYFYKIALKNANGVEIFNTVGHYITINATQRTNLVDKLNGELVSQGVDGSFEISSNTLFYNGTVNSAAKTGEVKYLTNCMIFDFEISTLNPNTGNYVNFEPWASSAFVYASNPYLISSNNPTANPSLITTGSYSLPLSVGNGSHRVIVFFDGELKNIPELGGLNFKQMDFRNAGISSLFNGVYINNVSDTFQLNPALLGNLAKTIMQLYIETSGDWQNFITFDNLVYGELPYSNLNKLLIQDTAITSTNADYILNNMYTYAMAFKAIYAYDPFKQGIIIDFRSNDSSVPTAASALAQNYIINILNGVILS